MKKITFLLALFITSLSSYAITDGTYNLTGAPFTGTITFDNTAQMFTITITSSPVTGYLAIGFSNSATAGMAGTYAIYASNSNSQFALSEHTLADYNLGTTLTTQAAISSQNFANGDITITRAYTATNGGFSFTGDETELHFIAAKGSTTAAYHDERMKGTISIGSPVGVNNLSELEGLQVFNNSSDKTIGIKFPAAAEGIYDVEIINSVGQTLVRKQLNSSISVHSVNELSGKPAGIYFVRLSKDDGFTTKQVIKN